jgi:hypothetical protein
VHIASSASSKQVESVYAHRVVGYSSALDGLRDCVNIEVGHTCTKKRSCGVNAATTWVRILLSATNFSVHCARCFHFFCLCAKRRCHPVVRLMSAHARRYVSTENTPHATAQASIYRFCKARACEKQHVAQALQTHDGTYRVAR